MGAYSVSVTLLLVKSVLLVLRLAACVYVAEFKLCVLAMKDTHLCQDAPACCLDSTPHHTHSTPHDGVKCAVCV